MRTKGHALARLLLPLIAAAVIMWFFTALGSLNEGQREQGRARLELSLRRAAVAEYAVSGEYPATLEQLVERSGIQIILPAHTLGRKIQTQPKQNIAQHCGPGRCGARPQRACPD